jgi:hypothetical protein
MLKEISVRITAWYLRRQGWGKWDAYFIASGPQYAPTISISRTDP